MIQRVRRNKTTLLDALWQRTSDEAVEAFRRLSKGENIYDDTEVYSVTEDTEPLWLQQVRGDA